MTEASALLEELKGRARDLFALLRSAPELAGGAAAMAIEKTAAEVADRLAREERTVLVLGGSADRRAVFDALLGEAALGPAQREPKTTTRLRSRPVMDYEAKLRGDAVERFQQSVPERDEAFAKAIARADRDRAVAEEEAGAIASAIEAEQRRAKTLMLEPRTYERYARSKDRLVAIWTWLLAWIHTLFSPASRAAGAGHAPGALPSLSSPQSLTSGAGSADAASDDSLESRARDAAARIARATDHRATLEADRERYVTERRKSFFAALRTLADDLSRGGEVAELTIDVPSPHLPAGITLLLAPELRAYEGIDGCLVVTDGAGPARPEHRRALDALGATGTRTVAPGASVGDLRRAIAELRRAAPLVAGEKAIALARSCIGGAFDEAARAEAVCHDRIAALEGQRLADPAEFRARSMARMEKAIDDGARDVVRAAVERLPPRADAVKAEWRAAIFACTDRKAIEACVQSIRDTSAARIGALVDETNDQVVAEMQRASDTMQLWLLEEIHARYQVARRLSVGDGPAPVITEAGSGDFVALDGAPFQDAMDAFEQRRVGYGLGGAAAGAVLGTLVAPVIGTAIGAFLGVFAGLLKGIDSLAQDCAAKIDACVDESAAQIRAQLEARQASLADALRASLEDALDASMQRFARSITRLLELETRTLAAERDKLARLADLRAALEAHEARLTALAAVAVTSPA